MRPASVLAALSLLAFLPAAPVTAAPKNVLIIRGESADLVGGRVLTDAIQATIRRTSASPVEFYLETLDTGRFTSEKYERRLADLLAEKYTSMPLDLVVAWSAPAVEFAVRERAALFPHVPLLLGLVERRLVDPASLPADAAVVYVRVDAAATLRLALTIWPSARRVLVAGGNSRFDRGWQRLVREDLREFEKRLPITYDTDSSLVDLLRTVSALPPDAIVLYTSMTRDGGNVPRVPVDVLESLRATSPVPIFALSSTHLGHGMVGGTLLDFERHGVDLGHQAARMLAGEHPAPMTSAVRSAVDWREIQRLGIPPRLLPAATAIAFREPGLWERQRGTLLTAGAVVAVETALIVALVRAGRRRREAQRLLETRLRFERALSDLSVAIATAWPGSIDTALDAELSDVAAALGVEHVWRWNLSAGSDREWDSPALRRGGIASFGTCDALPASLRRRLPETLASECSCVAVALAPDGVISGALFAVSRDAAAPPPALVEQLQVVAALIASAVQRRQAEDALAHSVRLKGAILDSLPAHVVVLDRSGVIIAVNDAWREFGRAAGDGSGTDFGPGTHYVRTCLATIYGEGQAADEARAVIEEACRGERCATPVEYSHQLLGSPRWFLMTAEPLRRDEGGAVVTHWEITERKRTEIALRESEDRFRRMSDGLPIAIWMSGVDGRCIYVNKQWLQTTGRSLDEEYGDGWLHSVHVADRSACTDAYLRAFHMREAFRLEYRLRQADGKYRWVIDSGVPRYGNDGEFHGYVGGCIDITDSKNAERMLRELSHSLMEAQDEERRRIARELHDHLSQQLALLAIELQQLAIRQPASAEALDAALQDLWRRTTEIASDVHAISHRLHPSKMEALGLVATIRAHCRDISRQSVAVRFEERNVPGGIAPERALSLFRVLEEALSNVTRHSGAIEAHVTLAGDHGDLILSVRDNGRGFSTAEPTSSGLGLVSMRERVQALDGTLSVTSVPGQGTLVEARVPLAAVCDPPSALDAVSPSVAESA